MADAPLFAVLGALGGSLVTAVASLGGLLHQNRSQQDREHRQRAFERHLTHYERIFATARSALDAFRNLDAIRQEIHEPDDPFLSQMLTITASWSNEFCLVTDWQHNPAMAYLDLKLEERCLAARELLLEWLSTSRVTTGDIASIRRGPAEEDSTQLPLSKLRKMRTATYVELRIERRTIVTLDTADQRRIKRIERALATVIADLKTVIAY